jgi:hypothetical protein
MAKRHLTMKDIQKMREEAESALERAVFVAISEAIIFLILFVVFSIIKFKKWVLRD